MRTKSCGLAVLATVLLATSQAWGQAPFQWESNLQSAAGQAAATNRLVLVHFWAHWCQACLRMEQEVFSQPDVQAAIQADYVAVRLNVDHNKALAQQFGISSLPTDVVITPDGRLLERQPGFIDRYQYVARLRQVAVDARRPPVAAPGIPPAGPAAAASGVPAASIPAPRGWTPPVQGSAQPSAGPVGPPGGGVQANQANQAMTPSGAGLPVANAPDRSFAANGQPGDPGPAAGWTAPLQSPAQTPAQPAQGWQPPQANQAGPPLEGPVAPQSAADYWMPLNTSAGPTSEPAGPPATPPPGPPSPPTAEHPVAQPPDASAMSQPAPTNPALAANVSQPQPAPSGAQGACPFALDGFCPVELVENKNWKLGDIRWGANHRGRTYLFSGIEQQQRFLKDPDRYSPVASGVDVVLATGPQRQVVPGRREYGVFCADRIFLFSSEETLAAFSAEPERYLQQVQTLDETAARPANR